MYENRGLAVTEGSEPAAGDCRDFLRMSGTSARRLEASPLPTVTY